MCYRIGIGYDTHRLEFGRKLIIGGVEIPYEKGLLGHSDADVLVHAIMDALLGAAGKGDIGRHFPDTNSKYRGISSMKLLEEVIKMIRAENFTVVNIDSVIIAQKPRLAKYIINMQENISKCIGGFSGIVNVKATTEEGLGFVGRMEGISAKAVCLIKESNY